MRKATLQLDHGLAINASKHLVPTIAALSLLQAIVAQFVVHGIPLFLRQEGHSATLIGLVYIASLPYVLRFLWAPLIDRHGITSLGHFRSWIFGGHALACAALAFMLIADPAGNVFVLLPIITVLTIGVACQLTATGGLMVGQLIPSQRAKGVAAQSAGAGSAGFILGFCVLYMLGDLGWTATISALLAFALAGLGVMGLLRLDAGSQPPENPTGFWSHLSIMKRPDTRKLLVISILVAMGLVLTYGLKSIVLIDAGYTVSEAGLVGLLFGNAAGVVCALAVRPLVDRWGGMVCLAAAGVAVFAYCLAFAVMFSGTVSKFEAAAFAIIANGLLFGAFVASRSLIMERCSENAKASEFATFVSFEGLASLVFAGIGNALFGQLGYPPVLVLAGMGSLCGAWYAWHARAQFDRQGSS